MSNEKCYLARAELYKANTPMTSFWLKGGKCDPLVWESDNREPMVNMLSPDQVGHLLGLLDSGMVEEVVKTLIQQKEPSPEEAKYGVIELFVRDYVSLELVAQVKIRYVVNATTEPRYSFNVNKSMDLITQVKMTESQMGKLLLDISEEKAASMTNEELSVLAEEMKVLFVPGVHAVFNEIAKRLRM